MIDCARCVAGEKAGVKPTIAKPADNHDKGPRGRGKRRFPLPLITSAVGSNLLGPLGAGRTDVASDVATNADGVSDGDWIAQ